YDFIRDADVFVRRRFTLNSQTLRDENLLNIALWIDNPPAHNPLHKNGLLSMIWFAFAIPFIGRRLVSEGVRLFHVGPPPHRFLGHAANILNAPHKTIATLLRILYERYLQRPGKPGVLIRNKGGRYALRYHAEHTANPLSRVTLSDASDALGMPRLLIDFRFNTEDAASVVRAHEILDEALRSAGVGLLDYRVGGADRLDLVMQQASDGFHQMGTTRMGASPTTSIVDMNCRVHGLNNLFVVSTSVFPTSGQAHPTFLGIVIAFRLAKLLANLRLGAHAEASDARS
ncbi:MAG: GMC family oxidoreductase, partial [Methylocella sp.]